jgi:hypothetical protein
MVRYLEMVRASPRRLAALLLAALAPRCAVPLAAESFGALPAHPRLILTPAAQAALAALANSADAFAADNVARTLAQARWLNSTVHGPLAPGAPLGDAGGRPFVQAIYSLVAGAVLEGEAPGAAASAASGGFRAAAVALTAAVARASEWDPNGTAQLNTGETLHAMGLALDWLYADMSSEQRAAAVAAIVAIGLERVRAALSDAPPPWAVAFVSTTSNWNTVVLGGTIIACLAIEGEPGAPDWVPGLRQQATANLLQWSASAWGPDGAWPEGPNYGGYSARYLVPTVASLLTATGDDAGLRSLPGVLQAPRFILAALAPTRPFPTLWSYFDARTVPETLSSWLALAAWAKDAPAAAGVKAAVRAVADSIPANDTETTAMNAPLSLIYYTPLGRPGEEAALPLVQRFRGVETAVIRSSRTDENATFIAFKGLNTTGNWAHTHLDQGSFVFATHGQFFASDLGSDQYSAPGYFSGSRFNLYRTNISGHNTFSFSGRNPLCKVIATYAANCTPALFDVFNESSSVVTDAAPFAVDVFAVVNLTEGLQVLDLGLARVQRGFVAGAGAAQLIVVDEIDFRHAGDTQPAPPVWWKLHTVANVSLSAERATATLTTSNVSVAVTVAFLPAASSCPGAAFSVAPLDLQPPLLDSPGVSVLRLEAAAAACERIVVVVGVAPPGVGAGLRPLGEWRAQGPFVGNAGGGAGLSLNGAWGGSGGGGGEEGGGGKGREDGSDGV